MIVTTLNRIRAHQPCADGWQKLLKHLGKTEADDEMLPFAAILESNGLADALWCCQVEPQYTREWRLYAVWCARQVQHLITDDELKTAWTASQIAAWVGARDAARDAAMVAQSREFLRIVTETEAIECA